ncbi:winged helix DNA-binding domain-containing protein [Paenibacillus ginsengarvi]|uniref:Winged helix DNA-binding domain-containing protein n=1 Tax=Paenibacillus ginsengarvi TaxID=400777 RepID=A0A3B0CL78_9BACL|nr:winged helix DNA-binding domain-containing protein [Paenibacillus ginsengarvi]RKN85962.1 winged helix DNA-binding domain-containing protein [Paenibacillus ginsengarvi]
METLKEQSIPYRRMHNLHIAGERMDQGEQVVQQLGALQAQDYHQALWAIGMRTLSSTVADIEQIIEDRRIVLTWTMRGTIHFVHPENVRWMLKYLASRLLAQDGRRLQQLELNQEIIERCRRIIYDTLQGNRRISRPHLMQLLEENGVHTKNQRGYHILWYLAQSGHICLGPREGKQQTFVLLEEWVPAAKELEKSEALALLAERYFTSHGPATVPDLAWWAGITLTDARQGVEAIRSRLVAEKINGQEYWTADKAPARVSHEEPSVYLLPGFDEYLLGYKDRSAVLSPAHAPHVVPGNNGVFMPTIVIDGQVSGIWKRTLKSKGIDIEFILFAPRKDREEHIIEAAGRYCRFMGLPLAATSFQLV